MEKPESTMKLSPEDIIEFKALSKPMQIKAGYVLFNEDEYTDYVYYIESGHVKLCRNTTFGRISLLSIRKTEELVGVYGVLTNSRGYVFAQTVDSCKLWRMTGEKFRQMLYARPKLAVQIASVMSKRMQDLGRAIVSLTSTEVDGRLAWLLLSLANNTSSMGQEGNRIDVNLTHQDLASMIGVCRQTVTTILGKFKDEGIIKISKRHIEIINRKKMEKYVS